MKRVLVLLGAGLITVVLSASTSWARSTSTDTVTTGTWGKGVAVVDPTVPANDSTPSAYAAIDLTITLRDANPGGITLIWDDGAKNTIGGCGPPACAPSVMKPGIYRFPYVAGVGGTVPEAGIGHFTLLWHDSNGNPYRARLPIQSDTGFASLPPWASPTPIVTDKVTSGFWGKGVAVVDPTVPANDSTPSNYAAIYLKITLRNAYGGTGLNWDDGPNNVIAGCGAPYCVPAVMKPGVYKFPYTAGSADAPLAEAGIGHFTLRWHDATGLPHHARVPIQSDTGFAHLPAWAKP